MERLPEPGLVGSNAERTRQHNRRVVLRAVRSRQPVGRAEIARLSGLSTQAVSNIIAELEGSGLLAAVGHQSRGRGLPSAQYALRGDGAVAFGLEVRPDAMLAALVNLNGERLFEAREPLDSPEPPAVVPQARALFDRALAAAPEARPPVLGAGVVMPGPFGSVGISGRGQTALSGWDGMDPAAVFEAALGVPVTVERDAIAATLAESLCGPPDTARSVAFLYFGQGLGLGVMAGGSILRGTFGNAGEIGHAVMEPGGRLCPCGNHGCLETRVSRAALHRDLAEAGIVARTAEDLARLHAAEDPRLMQWLAEAAPLLSRAIGLVENLFDPDTVVLGGALPDGLIDALIDRLDLPPGSVAARPDRLCPRVRRGGAGRMTAALGGAALVIHDAITPHLAMRR